MPVDARPAPAPGAVLFACNFNQVRSPMAEALLKLRVGTAIFVDSCGLKRAPALDDDEEDASARADPFVQAVMMEVGCDLTGHRAKTFDELDDHSFDLVISLTPEAQNRSVELTRGRAADIAYWPTFEPTLADGSRAAPLTPHSEVRDGLERRQDERLGR